MKKKVIILGASRYYLKSIQSARDAGFFVIALDRNPDSPAFAAADIGRVCDIIDVNQVLSIAKEYDIDGIIPLNDLGVPVAAFVSKQMQLPGITPEVAELSSNKELMRKRWIERNIPCPKIYIASTREEFEKGLEYVGFPCILKPAHGLGGASRGVIVVNKMEDVDDGIAFSQSFYEDKTTLIETFIDAELEHSVEVIVYKGEATVIAISDKVKTPLPYRVDKNVLYPTKLKGEYLTGLINCVKEAVHSLGITYGAAHVELATTRDGFVLFELGARCGGGGTPEPIVHQTTGINEFVELVRILVGEAPVNIVPTKNKAANYHFLTPTPGRVKNIEGLEIISNMPGVVDFDFFKKPGDNINEVKVGTDRSGFIITIADTREEAYKQGYLAEDEIKIEYEY